MCESEQALLCLLPLMLNVRLSNLHNKEKPLRQADAEVYSEKRIIYSPPNGFDTIFLLQSFRALQPSPAVQANRFYF